jgi:DNA mismatch repair ATPase MutS
MRKKIRLSEKELINLVHRVIREQEEDDVPVGYVDRGPDNEIMAKNQFITSVKNYLMSLERSEVNKYRTRGELPFTGDGGQLDKFLDNVEQAAEEARTIAK